MGDPFRSQPFPRGALVGAAALIGFTLLTVIVARLTDFKAVEPEFGPVAESRDLRFEDVAGGTVHVYEATSNSRVATLEPGSDNFIRGVLRGLARDRRSRDLGMDAPFRLTRYEDGGLTLEDRATGRLIDLQAFGATNAGAFSRLLDTDIAGP